jgi:signal peptidase I
VTKDDVTSDAIERRGAGARAGIAALNLLFPGLGLFRLGEWRAGILVMIAPLALIAAMTAGMGMLPITSYGAAVTAFAAVLALVVAIYLAPIMLGWRTSRDRRPLHPMSRWYTLVVIALVATILMQVTTNLARRIYKPFYAPSESMAPTIGRNDKFIADMGWRGPLDRGDIVIFQGPDGVRISRIAALAGDHIAMRAGVPVVNGQAATQTQDGQGDFAGYERQVTGTTLVEHLPGEAGSHRLLGTVPSEFDDMNDTVVPANHLFMLGDNRERSADSRVPHRLGGVGMVPESVILGRPLYINWSVDHSKIGTRLDR